MPDAILPALFMRLSTSGGVGLEPLIDVAKDHGIVGGISEAAIQSLRIWLVLLTVLVIVLFIINGSRTIAA